MTGRYYGYAWGKSSLSMHYHNYLQYRKVERYHVVPRPLRRRWKVIERKGFKGFPFSWVLNESLGFERQKELYQWSLSNVPGEIIITSVTDVKSFTSAVYRTCIRATDENALVMLKIKFG